MKQKFSMICDKIGILKLHFLNPDIYLMQFLIFFFNVGPLSSDLFYLFSIHLIWQQSVKISFFLYFSSTSQGPPPLRSTHFNCLSSPGFLLTTPVNKVLFKIQSIWDKRGTMSQVILRILRTKFPRLQSRVRSHLTPYCKAFVFQTMVRPQISNIVN